MFEGILVYKGIRKFDKILCREFLFFYLFEYGKDNCSNLERSLVSNKVLLLFYDLLGIFYIKVLLLVLLFFSCNFKWEREIICKISVGKIKDNVLIYWVIFFFKGGSIVIIVVFLF